MEWKNTDPRDELVGQNRASIVILRPSPTGKNLWEYGSGDVEMDHGWFIHTSFENHKTVEIWDPSWSWVLEPDFPGY